MKIRRAYALEYGFEDDGAFILVLLDKRGNPFATVTISEMGAEELADFLDGELLFKDSIGEVAGHA